MFGIILERCHNDAYFHKTEVLSCEAQGSAMNIEQTTLRNGAQTIFGAGISNQAPQDGMATFKAIGQRDEAARPAEWNRVHDIFVRKISFDRLWLTILSILGAAHGLPDRKRNDCSGYPLSCTRRINAIMKAAQVLRPS